jgi:uncharacterized membrane protein YbhN (UPF0104 family)
MSSSDAVVAMDEPPEPHRLRQRPDLIRLASAATMIAVVLALGGIGTQTSTGVESDIRNGAHLSPQFLLAGVTVLTGIAAALVPVGVAIERLIRRDGKRVADAVIAGVLACGASGLLNLWIRSRSAPRWLPAELTYRLSSGTTQPLHVYIATLIAVLTILGFDDRPTLRTYTYTGIGIYATATLMNGHGTPAGIAVTLLLGRAAAVGWRYARGAVNERPTGQDVANALLDAGMVPVTCRWQGEYENVRRYEVRCLDGTLLDVTVLDRDRQAMGLLTRVYQRIRLRGPAQRRSLFSLRRAINHEALVSYALREAGINTPRLTAVRELTPNAALLAHERVRTRRLGQLPKDQVTDELLARIWHTVADLGRHQIAHRRLALDSILVDEQGEIWLGELRNGEVAATDIHQRIDIAEAMTALALKAGPERTVRIGAQVLGEDRISAALPMLQPIVLTRTTRSAMRRHRRALRGLREEILALRPHAPAPEPVKLQRLSPRTLLTVSVACFAVYALLIEISSADVPGHASPWHLVVGMSPWWLLVAAGASALTYVSAALQLSGFVPEQLPLLETVLVQSAAGFVSLATPPAVGGIAFNARYLYKRGMATGPAMTAVGASQAVGFLLHVALIAVFGFLAGSVGRQADASSLVIAILLVLAILIMITMSVPALRRFAKRRLGPFFADSLPSLLDAAQNPSKLAAALGGTLSLSLLYGLCLWASIAAVCGAHAIDYPTAVFIFLTVQAVSSLAPTPAGMGAVETALGGAVTLASGIDQQSAVVAVLLFRMLSTYLPALPGYFALVRLRRRKII